MTKAVDLTEFRQSLFEFCTGARIVGCWPWSASTSTDRMGLCGREDVHRYGLLWPRLHPEDFPGFCSVASAFCNGDLNQARRQLLSYVQELGEQLLQDRAATAAEAAEGGAEAVATEEPPAIATKTRSQRKGKTKGER